MSLSEHEIVIEQKTLNKQYWDDLWNYRELFYFLAWRDIKVRYKQTLIGVVWAVIRPILTMVVFTFIFGGLAGLPSEAGVPYAIMVFAALLPWQFFSYSLSESSNSLIGNVSLVSKVYLPHDTGQSTANRPDGRNLASSRAPIGQSGYIGTSITKWGRK